AETLTGAETPAMLFDAIKTLLGKQRPGQPGAHSSLPEDEGEPARAVDPVHLAACVLLLDVAYADGTFSSEEREHLLGTLTRHFALTGEEAQLLMAAAERERAQAIDHFRYTNVLQHQFDVGQKMVLAEVMWGLVLADGSVDDHEHYLTRKISNLLELEPGYLSSAKARAAEGRSGEPQAGGRRADERPR
ncbi:MAG TPA: TerB family tellurite resistance protein, partial [Gemmatimonadaceae bacterium]|nr:TerB family tellurite resistance protein [Gemmatimonadaceae bacterium]